MLVRRLICFATVLLLHVCGGWGHAGDDVTVNFARQVRPLLTNRCFRCHGPDDKARESDLRLDSRESAIKELESGERAIVPGDSRASHLMRRVATTNSDERMPPDGSGDPLTDRERDLLRRWIDQGARFEQHWAFAAPVKAPLPTDLTHESLVRAPIDRFVLRRLETADLSPSPTARREVLIRRLYLDLTGLPPTLAEIDQFVDDSGPDAYERLVDRLLGSPAYGERWARGWLDLARYADSAGYAQDPPRVIWRYRDWVIQAFNDNLPFDQFSRYQIAGDMLTEPREDQLLATAFHRNTMTNSEGGTDDEEFRNAAVVDRVNTTMQVWMGLTMGCAQCHSHKYDPITQREYFGVFAIFNSTEDADRGDERPTLTTFSNAMQGRRERLQEEIAQLENSIAAQQEKVEPTKVQPTKDTPAGPLKTRFVRIELPAKNSFLHVAEIQAFAEGENHAVRGKARQSSTDFGGSPERAIDGNTDGDYQASKSVSHTKGEDGPWWEVRLDEVQVLDSVVVWNRTDNGTHARLKPLRVVLLDDQRRPIWVKNVQSPPNPSQKFELPASSKQLDDVTQRDLAEYVRQSPSQQTVEHRELAKKRKELASLKGVTTPIQRELSKPRKTYLQYRGNFLDKGPEVTPGVPAAFHSFPGGAPLNRKGFADWLVDRKNPLTARVAVNRIWEQLFGIGLVVTSEDFGIQGSLPSHPALLDFLAVEFMEQDWDLKQLLRQIVTSSTYRQTSKVSPKLLERDPRNRWLARGPRFRLSAEMIRDQALSVGGLLSRRMLGPSVQPPRPVLGLRAAFGGSTDWKTSPGENRFRRGLYTSWRRTTPYPSMTTFDAPSREFCTVRRLRTNTPLQALVTLNDAVFVEAAQGLARRIISEGGADDASRVTFGFRVCTARHPGESERGRLLQLYRDIYARLRKSPQDARSLATDPIGPAPPSVDIAALAAWTVVGNVLLNLDETIAKR